MKVSWEHALSKAVRVFQFEGKDRQMIRFSGLTQDLSLGYLGSAD